jgi:hypothetical protein
VDFESAILFFVSKRVRRFAFAVLLLALPVQAFAAASMLYCNGDHHATWLQVATDILLGRGIAGTHNIERSDHHVGGTVDVAHDASDASDQDDAGPDTDDHRGSQCSSCSDCCCAASIPSSGQPTVAIAHAAIGPNSIVAQFVSGYVPERLERPPRNPLA